MSGMKQLNQRGHMDPLLIPLIIAVIFFVAAGSFGIWAFISRQDYKNNSDQKAAAAVVVAEEKTSSKKDNEFLEKEKQPYKLYEGPSAYGSLVVSYPKTWSAYISEKTTGSTPLDAFFHPGFVPAVDGNPAYALRIQVVDQSYATVLKSFDSFVKSGKVTAAAYVPPQAPTITGVRLEGDIVPNKKGAMILLPIRDKTLKIWVESPDFVKDLDTHILPNYKFSQ